MRMKAKTFVEEVTSTKGGTRAFNQECAILELTELICRVMQETGVGRAELARRLGKTKGYVTQLLDGRANMTLRTIADVFTALGRTIRFDDGSGRDVVVRGAKSSDSGRVKRPSSRQLPAPIRGTDAGFPGRMGKMAQQKRR